MLPLLGVRGINVYQCLYEEFEDTKGGNQNP